MASLTNTAEKIGKGEVDTLEKLAELDQDEIVRGYRDGFDKRHIGQATARLLRSRNVLPVINDAWQSRRAKLPPALLGGALARRIDK